MFEDNNAYLLFDPFYWVFVIVILLLCWVPTAIARRALNGRWRSWVLSPGIPFQVSARNVWPFMFAAVAVSLWIATLSLPAELLGWEELRQRIWDFFFIPWAFVILSFFWWPLWLSPRWYRRWGKAGGTRRTNPWTESEISAVNQQRESKSKAKTLKDIERCAAVLSSQSGTSSPVTSNHEEDHHA